MAKVIEVENLSKMYRLGEVGTGTLSHDLNRWWHKIRGKEDPYLSVVAANNRAEKAESDYVWSLKDINFSVEEGDIVGIIGRNGAGKSTLLKVLSNITSPTTGSVKIKGRIASLLEVGTGFHPEMTGRENIYMNGTIMGMRKHEITSKLDEIIDFAGVAKYLDTPVKRYSSGMLVRLGFAIAAHLEPEILIVDEVLAVGDAEFQKKCIGKMQDVSHNQGRTVLFVSHNMAAIQSLCKTGIMLTQGQLFYAGDINDTTEKYLESGTSGNSSVLFKLNSSQTAQIIEVSVINNDLQSSLFYPTDLLGLKIKYTNRKTTQVRLSVSVWNLQDTLVLVDRFSLPATDGNLSEIVVNFELKYLLPDQYKIIVALDTPGVELYDILKEGVFFEIDKSESKHHLNNDKQNGVLNLKMDISFL